MSSSTPAPSLSPSLHASPVAVNDAPEVYDGPPRTLGEAQASLAETVKWLADVGDPEGVPGWENIRAHAVAAVDAAAEVVRTSTDVAAMNAAIDAADQAVRRADIGAQVARGHWGIDRYGMPELRTRVDVMEWLSWLLDGYDIDWLVRDFMTPDDPDVIPTAGVEVTGETFWLEGEKPYMRLYTGDLGVLQDLNDFDLALWTDELTATALHEAAHILLWRAGHDDHTEHDADAVAHWLLGGVGYPYTGSWGNAEYGFTMADARRVESWFDAADE